MCKTGWGVKRGKKDTNLDSYHVFKGKLNKQLPIKGKAGETEKTPKEDWRPMKRIEKGEMVTEFYFFRQIIK